MPSKDTEEPTRDGTHFSERQVSYILSQFLSLE